MVSYHLPWLFQGTSGSRSKGGKDETDRKGGPPRFRSGTVSEAPVAPEDQIVSSDMKNHSEFSDDLLNEVGSDIIIIQPKEVVKEQGIIHKSEGLGVVVADEEKGIPYRNVKIAEISFFLSVYSVHASL